MRFTRPSRTGLAGAILFILAIVAAFLVREELTEPTKRQESGNEPDRRISPSAHTPFHPGDSRRLKRVDRIEKLISEQFSKEHEAAFHAYQDGMSLSYTERGLLDFYGRMRSALRGDEDSVAEIFTTYGAGEDERYGFYINTLIENLGDDFFFRQIQRQPESTQSVILGQIWQKIDRFPLEYQSDGSIPAADSGRYYPKTGGLFLKLLDQKLETDHWRRQKKKSEQPAPSNGG